MEPRKAGNGTFRAPPLPAEQRADIVRRSAGQPHETDVVLLTAEIDRLADLIASQAVDITTLQQQAKGDGHVATG